MGALWLNYRDPLVGVMAFLLIALLASLLSILFSKLKEDGDARKIRRFLQRFSQSPAHIDYASLLREYPDSYALLSKAAKAHFDGGDYEGALNVYLALLESLTSFDRAKRAEIFERLGDIYIKSGFLGRSMDAYEQSLSIMPRNESALRKITAVYEKRGEFKKALEALEAIEELGADVGKRKLFFETILALKSKKTSDERVGVLLAAKNGEIYFARELLKEALAFKNEEALAALKGSMGVEFLDILWIYAEESRGLLLKLQDPIVIAVLEAKGIRQRGKISSKVFELDVFRAAKSADKELALDLNFEFVCKKCGYVDIDYFFSCKSCATDGVCESVPKIVKKSVFSGEFLESW